MKYFIGIRFSRYGQVQVGSFESLHEVQFEYGQTVVVQCENALHFGHVVWQSDHLNSLCSSHRRAKLDDSFEKTEHNSKSVIRTKGAFAENFEATQIQTYSSVRIATDDELKIAEQNVILSQEAHVYCKKCVRDRELDMKLVDVEVLLDKSKIIFYFTAPMRIDFRELVKDLVREYRTRIELRQIGVRHETQMLGTLGNCGMAVCCRRYLKEFAPVTIKMAKEQNLFLNPSKVSGMCGRLLCCLSYEQESYDAFHKATPKVGKVYQTQRGDLRVIRTNMFHNSVTFINESNEDSREEEEVKLEDWDAMDPKKTDSHNDIYNSQDSDSMYNYMDLGEQGLESDSKLSELLDDTYETNQKRTGRPEHKYKQSTGQNHERKMKFHAQRPREKAQKRANYDALDTTNVKKFDNKYEK